MLINNKQASVTVDIDACYKRAEQLEQGTFTKRIAFNTRIHPHWIGDSNCFWYIRDKMSGKEYRLVNAETANNTTAFDHQALAKTLGQLLGEDLDPDNLPLLDLEFDLTSAQISFSAFNQRWHCDTETYICQASQIGNSGWKLSPDGTQAIFSKDYNLWIRDIGTGKERALTTDGHQFFVYGGTTTVYGRQEVTTLEAIWSPDSKKIFTVIVDTNDVKNGPPLVQHVPNDGSLRPTVLNPMRRIGFSQDEQIEHYKFLVIHTDTGTIQFAQNWDCPVFYPPYIGYFSGNRGWWDLDSRHAYFIHQQRGGQLVQLVKLDTQTGSTSKVIEESSDAPISTIPITHLRMISIHLPESNELIWFSERSGTAHLYLYNLSSGTLKNPITEGNWVVRNILHYDKEKRQLLIQTAGRVSNRNPYYCDICRVNIDSGELSEVISTNHEYMVSDRCSRASQVDSNARGVANSGNYIVTSRSRVDTVPVSLLLDNQGNEIMTLETADISNLPESWHWPEPVILKAADGKTDIYGVVFRPSNFDPDQSYPVLDCSHAFCAPVGSFANNSVGSWHYLTAAAYAELGFIVVMINNRGNDGLRDTAFISYQDPVLPVDPMLMVKYNKADCIAGIEELAERYSYMDISRVGIVEFGSVPSALMGLFMYPDFYKVGVTNNPMADYRMMAALGNKDGNWPQLEEFAGNLKGKLLLIAGMLDDVMPVSMTFRIVAALSKANKNFDMLLLPDMGHAISSYALRRSWDYIVTHLAGVQPPEDFKLTTAVDLLMQGEE